MTNKKLKFSYVEVLKHVLYETYINTSIHFPILVQCVKSFCTKQTGRYNKNFKTRLKVESLFSLWDRCHPDVGLNVVHRPHVVPRGKVSDTMDETVSVRDRTRRTTIKEGTETVTKLPLGIY